MRLIILECICYMVLLFAETRDAFIFTLMHLADTYIQSIGVVSAMLYYLSYWKYTLLDGALQTNIM